MKKILYFIFAFVITFNCFATNKTEEELKEKTLLSILRYILTEWHYEPTYINDTFSEKVYTNFIKQIDPAKRYLLQSDIDEFSQYKYLIDDLIKNEDLTFFHLVYNRLMLRMKESKSYYKNILATPFNFNLEETFDADYENRNHAKSVKEIMKLWHSQLKLSTLSKIDDKISAEKDKQKEEKDYTPKTFEEIEIESRKEVEENMDDFYIRLKDLNEADWFATFLNCIAEEFDPHTSYFPPARKKQFDISMAGKIEGIGAQLQKKNDYTRVSALISGGPAWKGGELEIGDLIIKVAQGNEEPVNIVGMRLDNAIEYIKGKKGTEVRLTVKKLDGSTKVISIIRDVVELEETFIKSAIVEKNGKKYGIINLPRFYIDFKDNQYRTSATDMEKEIKRLKKEKVEGLIIDLRNNGGGSLKTAIEISGLFIKEGPIVQVKYRGRTPQIKKDTNNNIQWNGPLVVMVNEISASASEIFAAAMQDYKRAIVIGSKNTYGKGTVQSFLDLNKYHKFKDTDLGALKITIQKFYRINGKSTQLEGVTPDIIVPSRYQYMKIGERELESPLVYDMVQEAKHTKWDNYKNTKRVIKNSNKRINKNSYFTLVDDNAKWLKKSQDDTMIHLNYKAYKEDLKKHQKNVKKYDELKNFSTNLTYYSPLYEKELTKNDEDLLEKRERWHKNLKKDAYVAEAINVLSELKIK